MMLFKKKICSILDVIIVMGLQNTVKILKVFRTGDSNTMTYYVYLSIRIIIIRTIPALLMVCQFLISIHFTNKGQRSQIIFFYLI